MRRSSNAGAVLKSQSSEPIIVVEDEACEEDLLPNASRQSSEEESTSLNPYLLTPYAREIRKYSLPTSQCSGITASHVRRLFERGETTGPGPRQAEFLATLSQVPQTGGGRRYSVVTISKVPPALFGRNRRESVAAFPAVSLTITKPRAFFSYVRRRMPLFTSGIVDVITSTSSHRTP